MATNPKSGSNGDAVQPKKSKKKILLLVLIALILAGGGGGGAWWYFKIRSKAGHEPQPVKAADPIFMALDQFTVNLNPDGGEHYLQTSITLQLASKDDIEYIKLYMPQIRSRILLLLTSKKATDIATTEGKRKLSDEIKEQINMPVVPHGKPLTVLNVFFTAFVIQ